MAWRGGLIHKSSPLLLSAFTIFVGMKLSEIGEFGFIERFAHRFEDLLGPNAMGIGDDCAILPAGDHDLVITTDMLVEDIHFIREKMSALDLGHKALAVNLSDVAAMGARPTGSFLSIAIPSDVPVEYLDELMEGYHELSAQHQLPLMGGDTTRSPQKLVLNISVIGTIAKGQARLRSGAQVGDHLVVTSTLGDSAAGLQVLLNDWQGKADSDWLLQRHLRPQAHVAQGQWLAQHKSVHAMMDVSDGIASDLQHILKASKKGAHIDLDQLPLSPQLQAFSRARKMDAHELATSGGEDYCLLLTVAGGQLPKLREAYKKEFGEDLYPIGHITEAGGLQWQQAGKLLKQAPRGGFNHFV